MKGNDSFKKETIAGIKTFFDSEKLSLNKETRSEEKEAFIRKK